MSENRSVWLDQIPLESHLDCVECSDPIPPDQSAWVCHVAGVMTYPLCHRCFTSHPHVHV